jgi:hypothetical protein
MKKIALILLTGWLSIGLFWGGLPVAAALASPQTTGMASATIDHTAPFSGVDDFLQSIPRDYYAVPQIGALKEMLQDKAALLIDVREPSEFRRGHIPGAMNMPLRSLTDNLDKHLQGSSRRAVLFLWLPHSHGGHGLTDVGIQ